MIANTEILHMLGTILNILYALAPLILTTALQGGGGANFIPSSQMKRLRHRVVENFLQAKWSLGLGPRFEAR